MAINFENIQINLNRILKVCLKLKTTKFMHMKGMLRPASEREQNKESKTKLPSKELVLHSYVVRCTGA